MRIERKILHTAFGFGGRHCHCCFPQGRRKRELRVRIVREAKKKARAWVDRDLRRFPAL